MGVLLNQNLTLDSSQPEVTQWESTPHLSSAVNNTIVLLGVLTFALQLCLVLLFMLRCWRLDNRVRDFLKEPETLKLIAPPSCHKDFYKPAHSKLADHAAAAAAAAAASPPVISDDRYEPVTHSLFGPPIPWDLVQR